MKARIVFYCVVIAVLLATLAAIPSHATERRDTLLNQDCSSGPVDERMKKEPPALAVKRARMCRVGIESPEGFHSSEGAIGSRNSVATRM